MRPCGRMLSPDNRSTFLQHSAPRCFSLHAPVARVSILHAFTNPPLDPTTGEPTRQGDFGRNALRGFGAWQWDFAVHRDFPFGEHLKLQFRAEMFNVLNHPDFGPPVGTAILHTSGSGSIFGWSSQTLGQSLNASNVGAGAFSPLYQFGGPRSVQLALKLTF